MSKVFLLTDGCYSDYHIVAAFSTEEKAGLAMKYLEGGIEEFELDEGFEDIADLAARGLHRFAVQMDWEGNTSDIRECSGASSARDLLNERVLCAPSGWRPPNMTWMSTHKYGVYGEVLARDEQHAVKIVNEWRARAIAENLHLCRDRRINLKTGERSP